MPLIPIIILVGVALAPAVFIVLFLWLRDRYEREPLKLVWRAFLCGALSAIPAYLLERYVMVPLGVALGYARGFEGILWQAFFVAALVEESCKALFARWAVWKNANFNEPMDGIVYFGTGALGFAALENILYTFHGGLITALDRAFLSVPGHALFGVIMGYHFGLFRFGNPKNRTRHLFLALLAPMLLHGLYDTLALNMQSELFAVLMYPLVAYLWVHALKDIGEADRASPFNDTEEGTEQRCQACSQNFTGPQYLYCPYCGTPLVGTSAPVHASQAGQPPAGEQS